jgi:phage terminase small subunit
MSQREAYIKAGYSNKQSFVTIDRNACGLLKNNKVLTRLEELRQKTQNDKIASVIECQEILTEIIRAKQTDFMTCSADGVWMHDVGNETLNTHAIKQIQTTTMPFGGNDSPLKILLTKVELHDPLKAIDLLNKMRGLYSDGTNINIGNREIKNTQIIIGDTDVAEALAILINAGAVRVDSPENNQAPTE